MISAKPVSFAFDLVGLDSRSEVVQSEIITGSKADVSLGEARCRESCRIAS